ncbi:MAG: glycosyltransferase, partial [Chloroflexi bacterium]|nr:glycosyltransferase [Chloroflexota bacterium]
MLTPDEGHLDRRIAQEAATLAAQGWTVDIHPAVDPHLAFDGDLPPAVRLLANPRPPVRPSGPGRAVLRRVKRRLDRLAPPVARFIEAVQYRRRDIAREITDANAPNLLAGRRYDLVVAHDVPVMPLAVRLAARWNAAIVSDLHEVFPKQDEYFTSSVARRYWRHLEGVGLAASDGIVCVNEAVESYARKTHTPMAPIAVVHN